MEFTVNFISEERNELFDYIGKPGIDVLDDIRSASDLYKNLRSEDISYYNNCPVKETMYRVRVSENTARESGLFNGKTDVEVYVDFKLSMFMKYDIVESWYEPSNWFECLFNKKRLRYITVRNIVDNQKVIDEWIKAGFPLNWSMK